MKKIAVIVLLAMVFASMAFAEDVDLGTPKQVLRSATLARVEIDSIDDSRINYTIRWRDSQGEIYSQAFSLTGADYDAVMLSNIIAGNVGAKIGAVLRNRILLKVKAVHGM